MAINHIPVEKVTLPNTKTTTIQQLPEQRRAVRYVMIQMNTEHNNLHLTQQIKANLDL